MKEKATKQESTHGAFIASAPGKILWIGGYSVLERGNCALVSAIDRRVYCKAKPIAAKGRIVFTAKQLGCVGVVGKYADGKIRIEDPLKAGKLKFVAKAAEASIAYLESQGLLASAGLELETVSDAAFSISGGKSGLGSSAAVTVATVAAILGCNGVAMQGNVAAIHKLAQFAHSSSQGKVGSGFDIAASTFGTLEYERYSPQIVEQALAQGDAQSAIAALVKREWDYVAKAVKLPTGVLAACANIVGESASTTEMVAKVKAFKGASPNEYAMLMRDLDEENRKAVQALRKWSEGKTGAKEEFKHHFRAGRVLTRSLGQLSGAPIETVQMTELIDASESNGAYCAKLPGAGGGDNISALSLSKEEKKALEEFWSGYQAKKLVPLEINISQEGVLEAKDAEFARVKAATLA